MIRSIFPYLSKESPIFLVLELKFFPLIPNNLLTRDERIEVVAYPYVGLDDEAVDFGSSPKTSLSIAERKSRCLVVLLPLALM